MNHPIDNRFYTHLNTPKIQSTDKPYNIKVFQRVEAIIQPTKDTIMYQGKVWDYVRGLIHSSYEASK